MRKKASIVKKKAKEKRQRMNHSDDALLFGVTSPYSTEICVGRVFRGDVIPVIRRKIRWLQY